jgi:hypothetical protein
MFGTIRKHQSGLWIVIIAVTILGMLVWTNQSGSNRGAAGNFGSIDNKAITATEMNQARKDVMLMYLLQTHPHQWPDASGADLERQEYQQIYVLRKMAEYNIHADADAAARLANLIIGQWDQGQAISMDELLKILKSKELNAEDLEHYLENDVAFKQLQAVVGLSGKVVTPDEIKSLYTQNYEELAVEAVFFSASNSLAKIPAPTPDALGQFYTNRLATYREPDKMQLSYAFYNVTNFTPQAEQQMGTNLNREVDNYLARMGTNSLRFGKTAEEAHAKVRELMLLQVAETNALAQAVSLQNEVVSKQTNLVENLIAAAKAKGLEVKETKPFDKEYGPSEMNLGANYPVSSFFELNADNQLNADNPLLETPVRGMDGVYVIAFKKLIPTHIPPLSEIQSRVENDYKFSLALRTAQMNGQSFAQTVTNELAHGKTFAQTCDATRITPVQLPPLSRATQRLPEVEDQADLNEFKNIAFGTPIGSVSRFVETPAGGFVVYVKQRIPMDEAKMATELPDFSNLVRERRQSEAFNIWFGQGWTQELNRGLREIQALHKQE